MSSPTPTRCTGSTAIEDPSSLLVEGIAQAAEGNPVTGFLRDEVTTGDQLWPLPESFADADVWEGAETDDVGLGYEIGGSLVDYVVSRWGARDCARSCRPSPRPSRPRPAWTRRWTARWT